MKRMIAAAFTAAVALLVGTTGYAQNVHLQPPGSNPDFTDQTLVLNMTGSVAGLGNGDVMVNLIARAIPTAVCANHGKHQPPGQNPAAVTVSGGQAIPAQKNKNGSVDFNVTTQPPTSPIPASDPDFSCPSANWTETIVDLAFTSATFTISQNTKDDPSVFTNALGPDACTFSSPTTNGVVDPGDVSC
jgi:hypothetical protein